MIILYIRIADKLCISLAHRGKSFREKAVSDFFFAFPDTLAESVFISSEISVKLRTKRPVVQIIFHTLSFPAGRLRKGTDQRSRKPIPGIPYYFIACINPEAFPKRDRFEI